MHDPTVPGGIPLNTTPGEFRGRTVTLLFAATIIGAVLIFSKLGGNGIANYDDCFYAQKGKEVLRTGSWMTLYYNGSPSFENPPFFIWLVAISFWIFGVGDFPAILPSALFGVLTIVLIFFLVRTLYDDWTAFASGVVLSTTFFFVKYARHAMIDVTLSFFVTLALLALLLAIGRDRRYFLLWGLSISACVLMKSVLGLFPPLITVIWLIVTRRWRILYSGWFLAGSAVALIIGCSWYVHQYLIFGSAFTDLHFTWLIYRRGFQSVTGSWTAHLSYLRDLTVYYWPWLPIFLFGLYRICVTGFRKNDVAALLLIWVVTIPLIMSLMQTRSSWYIMPVYPAAAVICGTVLSERLPERVRAASVRWTVIVGIVAGLIIHLTPIRLSPQREEDIRAIAPVVKRFRDENVLVVGYGFDFHSVNNALLFYSDHAAEPVYGNIEQLASVCSEAKRTVTVLYTRRTDDVLNNIPGTEVIMTTPGLSLVSCGGSVRPGR